MAELALLAVFAHPDDETFGAAGTFAMYTGEGVRVSLVTATCGEAGEVSDLVDVAPGELCQVREAELREAMAAVGVEEVHVLGYPDGGVAEAGREEAVGKIVRFIRLLRPQVLITFGPDGIYGHSDHVAIHHLATTAASLAGESCRYREQIAEGLEPHTIRKLYYNILPKSRVEAMVRAAAEAGIEFRTAAPNLDKLGVPDDLLSAVIDARPYFDRKWSAIQAHRSQLAADSPFRRLPKEALREVFGFEYFQRAIPPPAPGEPLEDDLFAGLR